MQNSPPSLCNFGQVTILFEAMFRKIITGITTKIVIAISVYTFLSFSFFFKKKKGLMLTKNFTLFHTEF